MSHCTRVVPMSFLSVVIFALHANNAHSLVPQRVKGETQYNYLRHSVAISNSQDTYGKQGSTLLGRKVVSRHQIWDSVDEFTKDIFAKPDKLDWYIADVATDGDPRALTLNAGFSCIDLGQSNSAAMSWWVATNLSTETSLEEGVGGINQYQNGTNGSFNDIVEGCWEDRKVATFKPPRRLVEHLDQHRGTGVKMIKPQGRIDKPEHVVNDNAVFDRLLRLRQEYDRSHIVVYDESGIGVVQGLTFDSGIRIHAPEDVSSEKTIDYRVPMTPLCGVTTHTGARLRETRVDRGESRTSNLLLFLTVWASGLALLLAVWIMCKTISDILIARSERMRKKDVHSAVQGSGGWSVGEKALLFANFAAVTILLTPIGQAIVEGNIDPRSAIEVHYGANVFYTASGKKSEDENNPIAGGIFFVSSWITVRPLDDGFVESLTLSVAVILFFAVIIAMRATKKSSEIMRSSRPRWRGFSLWKLTGYIRMWVRSHPGRNVARYKVFIKLRADAYPLEGGELLEDRVKEVSLMGHETWRQRANKFYRKRADRHRDNAIREAAREASHEQLRKLYGTGCIGLFARVELDDKRRFRAATSRSTPYQDAIDRNWEYIRRGAACESIEWYRTNGQYPPDKALVLIRLGLLKYARFISEVTVAVDTRDCEYDRDGVRCYAAVATSTDVKKLMDGAKDKVEGFPSFFELDLDSKQPKIFKRNVTSEMIELKWLGGIGGKYLVIYPESSMFLRYCVVESSDFSVEGDEN